MDYVYSVELGVRCCLADCDPCIVITGDAPVSPSEVLC